MCSDACQQGSVWDGGSNFQCYSRHLAIITSRLFQKTVLRNVHTAHSMFMLPVAVHKSQIKPLLSHAQMSFQNTASSAESKETWKKTKKEQKKNKLSYSDVLLHAL